MMVETHESRTAEQLGAVSRDLGAVKDEIGQLQPPNAKSPVVLEKSLAPLHNPINSIYSPDEGGAMAVPAAWATMLC
jgi:hypothetical protein